MSKTEYTVAASPPVPAALAEKLAQAQAQAIKTKKKAKNEKTASKCG